MEISERAQKIIAEISREGTKLGDLRKVAKEIKKDHIIAQQIWNSGKFMPMLLAILIFDSKQFDTNTVDSLLIDINKHQEDERLQLTDWLMANQLMKDKKLIKLILSWQNEPLPLKRRIFWYYQARLRWTGKILHDNTAELVSEIEDRIESETPEVQWAMNLAAGWIGVFDKAYQNRCITIGEETGLYKDEIVAKNCTPNYLPKFIEIEANKRKL